MAQLCPWGSLDRQHFLEQRRGEGRAVIAPLRLMRLGLIDYELATCLQQELARKVAAGGDEHLLLLQHRPVFTRGRRSQPADLLVEEKVLRDRGARLVETDRGGAITFHGPGQLVCYPIIALRRHRLTPKSYLYALEETVIRAVREFGLRPARVSGRPGVWIGNSKLGAVGVRLRDGVATHGFSLNVSSQAAWFSAIVACGLADAGVTSMEEVLASMPQMSAVEEEIVSAFAAVLDVELTPVEAAQMPARASDHE